MAKDEEDDDVSLPPLGESSEKYLDEAKKGKPRNFLIICKGAKVKYLSVKKKLTKAADVVEAKKMGYKGEPYMGVITGKGLDLVFNLAVSDGYESAPVKAKVLKDFLEEHAGIKCKPTFEIVANRPEVPLEEDELEDSLVSRFQDLCDRGSELVAARAELAPEIDKTVAKLREMLQADDSTAAETQMDIFAARLDALAGGAASVDGQSSAPSPQPTDAQPASPTATVEPPAGGEPQAIDEGLRAKVQAALVKLVPQLKLAVEANPARKSELLSPVAVIKKQLEAGQLAEAKAGILDVAKLLKTLGTTPTTPVESPGVTMKDIVARVGELKVLIETARNGSDAEKAASVDAVNLVKQAVALSQKSEFPAATELLDRAELDLKRALPNEGDSSIGSEPEKGQTEESEDEESGNEQAQSDEAQSDEAQFTRLFNGVEPEYLSMLRQDPANASQLRAVMGFINGKAEQGDYAAAIVAVKRLSSMLDETGKQVLTEAVESQIDEEDVGRGVVAHRKALLQWEAARAHAFARIRSLQAQIVEIDSAASVERLEEVFGEIDETLHDSLIDCINAEDDADRDYFNQEVMDAIDEMRERIDNSEMIAGIDRNPIMQVDLGEQLKRALDAVATAVG